MPTLYEQRNVSMPHHLWPALEALAVEMNSRSTRGPKAYQHSWQTMFEEIAEGKILLMRKEQPVPQELAEAADRLEQEQRAAYEREAKEQGRDISTPHRKIPRAQLNGDAPRNAQRVIEQAAQKLHEHEAKEQAARKTPVKLEQLSLIPEPA
jgi:uncharacterized membrane protein YkoI